MHAELEERRATIAAASAVGWATARGGLSSTAVRVGGAGSGVTPKDAAGWARMLDEVRDGASHQDLIF